MFTQHHLHVYINASSFNILILYVVLTITWPKLISVLYTNPPHPLLVPRSRKSRAMPLLPLWAVRPVQSLSACTRVHFTSYKDSGYRRISEVIDFVFTEWCQVIVMKIKDRTGLHEWMCIIPVCSHCNQVRFWTSQPIYATPIRDGIIIWTDSTAIWPWIQESSRRQTLRCENLMNFFPLSPRQQTFRVAYNVLCLLVAAGDVIKNWLTESMEHIPS